MFFLLSGCTSGGLKKSSRVAQPVIDSSGQKIYSVDPKTGVTLDGSGAASDAHNFSQASVIIPSGTLAFPVSVSMYQAETLITPSTQSAAGVGDLTAAGPAVAVLPSQSVAVSGSLAISIPYNQPASLTSSWKIVVVAIYEVDGKTVLETFTGSELDLSTPGVVKLKVKNFGAFQVAYSQVEPEKKANIEVQQVKIVQKKVDPQTQASRPEGRQAARPVLVSSVYDPSGDYFQVELKSFTDGATIRFTRDGSNPGMSSEVYNPSTKIQIREGGTHRIKAIASKDGFRMSDVFEQQFEVKQVAPAHILKMVVGESHIVPFLVTLGPDGADFYDRSEPSKKFDNPYGLKNFDGYEQVIGNIIAKRQNHLSSKPVLLKANRKHLYLGTWKTACFRARGALFNDRQSRFMTEQWSINEISENQLEVTRNVTEYRDEKCQIEKLKYDQKKAVIIVEGNLPLGVSFSQVNFKLGIETEEDLRWDMRQPEGRLLSVVRYLKNGEDSAKIPAEYFTRVEPDQPNFWIEGPDAIAVDECAKFTIRREAKSLKEINFILLEHGISDCSSTKETYVKMAANATFVDVFIQLTDGPNSNQILITPTFSLIEDDGREVTVAKKDVAVLQPKLTMALYDVTAKNNVNGEELLAGHCYNLVFTPQKKNRVTGDYLPYGSLADVVVELNGMHTLQDSSSIFYNNDCSGIPKAISDNNEVFSDWPRPTNPAASSVSISFMPHKFIESNPASDQIKLWGVILNTASSPHNSMTQSEVKTFTIPEYPTGHRLMKVDAFSGDDLEGQNIKKSVQAAFKVVYEERKRNPAKTYIIEVAATESSVNSVVDLCSIGADSWPVDIRLYLSKTARYQKLISIYGGPDSPDGDCDGGRPISIVSNGINLMHVSSNSIKGLPAGKVSLMNVQVEEVRSISFADVDESAPRWTPGNAGNIDLYNSVFTRIDAFVYYLSSNQSTSRGGTVMLVNSNDDGGHSYISIDAPVEANRGQVRLFKSKMDLYDCRNAIRPYACRISTDVWDDEPLAPVNPDTETLTNQTSGQ